MLRRTLLGFVIVWTTSVGVANAGDWTQFQGNPAHTGYVPGTLDPGVFTELWSVGAAPYLNPFPDDRAVAIDNTTVYATMFAGSVHSGPYRVLGLDLMTGQEQWRHSVSANSFSGVSAPSLHDGRIYVHRWGHSGGSGADPREEYPALVGLDASDGSELFWTTHPGQWDSGSRPTPIGNQVFVAGGYAGGLDAYDAQSGARSWFRELPQQYGWIPAADDTEVYLYMGEAAASPGPGIGRLYAIDREQGGIDYEILHPESNHALRLDTEYNVAVGELNDAFALTWSSSNDVILARFDLEDQSIRWQLNGDFSGSMAIANGIIAIPNGSELSFIDEATGAPLWEWQAGGMLRGNVILTDNLAFASTGFSVFAIDLLLQESVWSAPIGGDLALAYDVLVVSNNEGITAFHLVPEPTSFTLLGFVGLAVVAKRRTGSVQSTGVAET